MDFSAMSKNDLRAKCREVGIKYSTMTVPQMREALGECWAGRAAAIDYAQKPDKEQPRQSPARRGWAAFKRALWAGRLGDSHEPLNAAKRLIQSFFGPLSDGHDVTWPPHRRRPTPAKGHYPRRTLKRSERRPIFGGRV